MKFSQILLLLILSFLSACSASKEDMSGLLGRQAPSTRFTMMDGSYQSLDQTNGKERVIIFWADWCAFSGPVIERLSEYVEDHPNPNRAVIAVSLDKNDRFEALKDRISYGKIGNLEHAFSGNAFDDEAYIAFNVRALPHIYVIDAQGKVIAEGHSSSVFKGH